MMFKVPGYRNNQKSTISLEWYHIFPSLVFLLMISFNYHSSTHWNLGNNWSKTTPTRFINCVKISLYSFDVNLLLLLLVQQNQLDCSPAPTCQLAKQISNPT